jgi:ATP-dependent protease HslVU (ClpYQ) peptidase subunit
VTAIAGFVHEGKVWIGGDSAGTSGWSITIRADQKVFRNDGFLFGFTTSFRMGQLLRYSFAPPGRKEGQDLYAYMVTDFINGIRDCLKLGGFATKDKEAEAGGSFLVGHGGRLFQIDTDYHVGEPADGYDAVGCGNDIAVGALFATKGMEPSKRMEIVLQAAERHSAAVRGPFVVESI